MNTRTTGKGYFDSGSRRAFLKKASLLGAGSTLAFQRLMSSGSPELAEAKIDGTILRLSESASGTHYTPLEQIAIQGPTAGSFSVFDGEGNEYLHTAVMKTMTFRISGALGSHFILLSDQNDKLTDIAAFRVNTKTFIDDEKGEFSTLLDILYWSMVKSWGATEVWRYNGRFYHVFVRWLRDHVHTMKGMKYFCPELKSGIDLYADTQREDGMIWDNIYPRYGDRNWWDRRFSYDNFILPIENGMYELKRIPVENDVEFLFIEGLYFTWKATGDDRWMESHLDKAISAVRYSTASPYRWSEKYKLLKRGFTIDTWDFQSDEDRAMNEGNDIMVVELGKTRFGVMFGDNTGMAAACGFLSEMLEHAGRRTEAETYRQLGKDLMQRLDALSWNGEFYTHHVPEDTNLKRDLGVDQSRQVSLSNAYSINRRLSHEQCSAIIKTYQRIRREMPASSPGEWYAIYPPFQKGFGQADASDLWDYMNGGVTSIVAGELAHGAFEHGYEAYGVDILRRIKALADKTEGYLHCTYRGAMPEVPERKFTTISLREVANTRYPEREAVDKQGKTIWDYPSFQDIPFSLLRPVENEHTCLYPGGAETNTGKVVLPVNQQAASVYFLHNNQADLAGTISLIYDDDTRYIDYITSDKSGSWWTVEQTSGNDYPMSKRGWLSYNHPYYIGFYVYGMNNPHPGKTIRAIEIEKARRPDNWYIMGITLCDKRVFFKPSLVSYGIPDNWGAAAVVYALVEGLAGIKDTGVAYNKALLAPRWEAAGIESVKATARYEASGGYLAYEYVFNHGDKTLTITFTGNAGETEISLLLPESLLPVSVTHNGEPIVYDIPRIESSSYLRCTVKGVRAHKLAVKF